MWFNAFSSTGEDAGKGLVANGDDEPFKGKGYIFNPDLEAAVDVAVGLERPLLVSGEPGCGKTELGYAIARRMRISRLYMFSTKSTSEARDLFYTFDAIGRFRDAQLQGAPAGDPAVVADYVEYQALGAAILDAHPKSAVDHLLAGQRAYRHPGEPQRAVVIIDEVDKASRDFPNDVLVEIESLQFRIPELSRAAGQGSRRSAPQTPPEIERRYRPIVVITSNEERQLPDAFLRRCIFHEIRFPERQALRDIVASALERRRKRTGQDLHLDPDDRETLLNVLHDFRALPVDKKAGVSEMIDAALLLATPPNVSKPPLKARLDACVVALAKLRADRTALAGVIAATPLRAD